MRRPDYKASEKETKLESAPPVRGEARKRRRRKAHGRADARSRLEHMDGWDFIWKLGLHNGPTGPAL